MRAPESSQMASQHLTAESESLGKADTTFSRHTREARDMIRLGAMETNHEDPSANTQAQADNTANGKALGCTDPTESTSAHFDKVLQLTGGTGRWQVLLFLWISTAFFLTPFVYFGLMFLGATPDFRCADGHPENATFHDIPEPVSRCYCANGAPCQRWLYDLDTDGDGEDDAETLVSKWDLVCDRKPMLSMLQSVLHGGGLLGAFVAGWFGDRIGRRAIFLVMCLLFVAAPLASTVVGSYEAYAVMRLVIGVGWVGVVNTGVVLVVELCQTRWRATSVALVSLPVALGMITLPGLAYSIRNWWQLQLVLAGPGLFYVFNVWLIPESPRWLILRRRDDEAITVLKTAARVNGKEPPDEAHLRKLFVDMRRCEMINAVAKQEDNLRAFVRSPTLRKWTAVTGLCWFAAAGGYYGLPFDVSQLSRSPYLACALLGLVEAPAFFSPPLLNRFGRRPVLVTALSLAGVAMLLFTVEREPLVWLILGMLGKFFIATAYVTLFIYTPEYIPTTVRTIGLGFGGLSCQFGAMVAPFIVHPLRRIDEIMPSVVFGCTCVLASVLALILPETVGRRLPDTVADLEAGVLSMPVSQASSAKEGKQGPCVDISDEDRPESQFTEP